MKNTDHPITERSLSIAEVAKVLGCSRAFAYAEVKAGRLPHVRLGPRRVVVEEAELSRYLELRRRGAEEAAAATAEHLDAYR